MADSKKRVAGTQLTRDDPDPDENEPEPEMGSFKKASEEVMATRKIVRVKRATQQTAPSVNPFSGIQLVPPPTTTTSTTTSQETQNENKNLNGDGTNKTLQNGEMKNQEVGEEIEKENKKTENVSVTETVEESKKIEAENVESKTENQKETGNEDKGSLSSFGQLSSGQNAFQGFAGTGFSTSSFSFGSGSTDGSVPVKSAFSNSGSVFGSKPDSSLKEVPVETGEENETMVFTADAVLFEFLQGGWKERGKGEVKLNVPVSDENGKKKPRLVMRTKGNYRLVLNASLYPDMALKDMDKRGVTFACLNSAGEEEEVGLGFSTFALKFRDGCIRDDFSRVVADHKGEKEKEKEEEEEAAVLKNPENSPKESDE